MPTVGDVLGALEEQLFVGRERELRAFCRWLAASGPMPEILDLFGPGGVGKSTLVAAFAREARRCGRAVVVVDGRHLPPTPEALLAALGDGDLDAVAARLNAAGPLLVVDTFEELADLTGYLMEEALPRLDVGVKVVVAGRYSLARAAGRRSWAKLVRPLPLASLSGAEAAEYLERRGVEGLLAEQVRAATGGYPLALTLAADLVTQLGVRDFRAAREWPLAVRSMVEALFSEVPVPGVRDLLEAAAVVRSFDEATLAAMVGADRVGPAFDRLCRLSVVRPAERGLTLADEVRATVAEDLRWRRPGRHDELRDRAHAYYRERLARASGAERGELLAERLYLWGHALVRRVLFGADEPGEVWVEPAGPEDRDEVLVVEVAWRRGACPVLVASGSGGPAAGLDGATSAPGPTDPTEVERLGALLRAPGARVRVARCRDGSVVGFALAVALDRASAEVASTHPVVGPLVRTRWDAEQRAALPERPDDADAFCLVGVFGAPAAARAALWRDALGRFAFGGTHLCAAASHEERALLEALGFEPLPGAEAAFGGRRPAGYVLDLAAVGVEAWLDAVTAGRRPPKALTADVVERELRAVLPSWDDDAALAASCLRPLAGADAGDGAAEAARALRAVVRAVVADARADARPDADLAWRAVEMAYLAKAGSNDRLAGRLAVSRSTFYRLLRRGTRLIAEGLVARVPPAPEEG